ncbi:sigma-70 family RNA polymerase sigma factor [Candidatus Latescibacterota bacterium]
MDDASLVVRSQAGEREAYGHLVMRYQSLVHGLCCGMTGSGIDAEDLAHDAFVDAFLKLDSLRDPARFVPWLRTLTMNVCRMWHRRHRREVEGLAEVGVAEETDDDDELLGCIFGGISRLSADHRLILALHYWEGLSYEEIATFLDVPMGTVMSRLHRARKNLKTRMDEVSGEDDLPVMPDDDFQRAVDAEIDILLTVHGDQPGVRERLSPLLERSPERFAQMIEAMDPSLADTMAILLRHLGGRAIGVAVDRAFSREAEVRARARLLLQRLIGKGRGRPRTGKVWMLPLRDECSLLLDAVIQSPRSDADKVDVLLDLIPGCQDEATGNLVVSVLLCYPDEAFPQLLDLWWDTLGEADKPISWPLAALCRTGPRFLESLMMPLASSDEDRNQHALCGLEAIAGLMDRRWLADVPELHRDLEVRARGALFSQDFPSELLASTHDRLAALLTHAQARIRDAALRSLGGFHALDRGPQIRQCLKHPELTTRLEAIRALSEMGDERGVPELMEIARSGKRPERRGAIQALGNLHAGEARGLLVNLVDDPEVQQAAIIALGDAGDEESRVHLERLIRSGDRKVTRLAASALYGGKRSGREPSETRTKRLQKVRGDAQPALHISEVAAIRALPETRSYREPELTRYIAQVVGDYSTTRRHLVMGSPRRSLMVREGTLYNFSELGRAVWRVERFIQENYLREE